MRCNQNAPVQKVDFLPSGSNKILMASARGLFQLNIETNVIDRLAMFRTAESWDAGSFVVWIFNVNRPILLKSYDMIAW